VPWQVNLRVRVGQSVTLGTSTWSNITGINSKPQNQNVDWDLVSVRQQTVLVNGNLMILRKKPGNVLDELQAGDMVGDGWFNADRYWVQATYVTGDVDASSSYDIINELPF
jgi:hypothetical protein